MEELLRVEDIALAFSHFGTAEVVGGLALFARSRVTTRVARSGEVDGHLMYTASVRGSSSTPLLTYLVFNAHTRRLVSAECTCPTRGDCAHCVAVLEALQRQIRDPRAASREEPAPLRVRSKGATPAPRPAAPEEPIDQLTQEWLKALAHVAEASSHLIAADTTRAAERLLFIVSCRDFETGGGRTQLGVFRAPLLADGTYGPRRILNHSTIDWVADPTLSPGDHALVIKLGAFTLGYAAIRGEAGARAFADVVATGRAYLEREGEHGSLDLLLSAGGPKRGALTFLTDSKGVQRPGLEVEGVIDGGILQLLPPFYVDMASGSTGPVEVPGAHPALVQTWLVGSSIPPDAAAAVARKLSAARLPFPAPAPRVRRIRRVDVAPVLVARLESQMPARRGSSHGSLLPAPDRPWVHVFFEYGGHRLDPYAVEVERMVGDEIVRISRRIPEEHALSQRLFDSGLVPVHHAFAGRALPPGMSVTLSRGSPFLLASHVDALASPELLVERAPDYAFDARVADDLSVELADSDEPATPRGAEFAVSLGLRLGDEVVDALSLVLAALRERVPRADESLLVTLPDGRTVVVPAARLLPLRRLLEELLGARDPRRLPRARALAIDPAVLSRSPASLEALRSALAAPRRVAVPRALRATLREYQREGFSWLMARRRAHLGAVLADDMGLGKTIQTLALLLAEERGGVPSLVVCPKSVLGNWESEAARFAPTLRLHVHQGPDRAARVDGLRGADVVLTTYPILARDAQLFASQRFATAVLDEAQAVKTRGSTFATAACAIQADFRLALSGTPMENHLGELWSTLRFVLPELFGDSRAFGRLFRRPIERGGDELARRELVARLRPFVLRRRKEVVASELPPKTVVEERIPLEDAQREVYETVRAAMDARVRDALAERGLAGSQIIVLDALLKLRQAVCDPRLLGVRSAKRAGSAKLSALIEKVRQLVDEGRRVLVFSQFVTMLDLVEAELVREKIPFLVLTGQTEDRASVVSAFQRAEAPVFLLSLKAGGTGLNLTAADVVIHYDPWWNPAAEDQATDRAHRIGQDKPVLVYKLLGEDTIEEKIALLQAKKRSLFRSVMDDGAGVVKTLTADDVAFLFAR